jgi:hypothetical protein
MPLLAGILSNPVASNSSSASGFDRCLTKCSFNSNSYYLDMMRKGINIMDISNR